MSAYTTVKVESTETDSYILITFGGNATEYEFSNGVSEITFYDDELIAMRELFDKAIEETNKRV